MLYKKYHRNYIRQFKRRAKFKFYHKKKEVMCDVVVEPSINLTHIDIAVIMQVNGDTYPERIIPLILIFSSGKLGGVNVEFIENTV